MSELNVPACRQKSQYYALRIDSPEIGGGVVSIINLLCDEVERLQQQIKDMTAQGAGNAAGN